MNGYGRGKEKRSVCVFVCGVGHSGGRNYGVYTVIVVVKGADVS